MNSPPSDGVEMLIGQQSYDIYNPDYGSQILNCIDIDVFGGEVVTSFILGSTEAVKDASVTAVLGYFSLQTKKPNGVSQVIGWSNNRGSTHYSADVGSG